MFQVFQPLAVRPARSPALRRLKNEQSDGEGCEGEGRCSTSHDLVRSPSKTYPSINAALFASHRPAPRPATAMPPERQRNEQQRSVSRSGRKRQNGACASPVFSCAISTSGTHRPRRQPRRSSQRAACSQCLSRGRGLDGERAARVGRGRPKSVLARVRICHESGAG